MVAYIVGCETYGLEAMETRAKLSYEFLYRLIKKELVDGNALLNKVNFEYGNACSTTAPFTTSTGQHISHVFSYNWASVDSEDFMPGTVARLNNTNFKLLVWNSNPH
jgi:hypothetical protein